MRSSVFLNNAPCFTINYEICTHKNSQCEVLLFVEKGRSSHCDVLSFWRKHCVLQQIWVSTTAKLRNAKFCLLSEKGKTSHCDVLLSSVSIFTVKHSVFSKKTELRNAKFCFFSQNAKLRIAKFCVCGSQNPSQNIILQQETQNFALRSFAFFMIIVKTRLLDKSKTSQCEVLCF